MWTRVAVITKIIGKIAGGGLVVITGGVRQELVKLLNHHFLFGWTLHSLQSVYIHTGSLLTLTILTSLAENPGLDITDAQCSLLSHIIEPHLCDISFEECVPYLVNREESHYVCGVSIVEMMAMFVSVTGQWAQTYCGSAAVLERE